MLQEVGYNKVSLFLDRTRQDIPIDVALASLIPRGEGVPSREIL